MLKIKNLFKSYGKVRVLKGVSLHAKKGTIKGLIGTNGSGKSTLIECVCGIKSFDSGEILINNIPISEKQTRNQVKHTFGFMPQNFSLFHDLTVEENLKYLSAVYNLKDDKRIAEVIKLCHLENHSKTLARNLSGGYRQLLSMAGAILHDPQFLLLDEPTASMDPLFRKKFWDVVKDFKRGDRTVLIVTHYMEELVECDDFACLSNGNVAFEGSVQEFKKEGLLDIESLLKKYTF